MKFKKLALVAAIAAAPMAAMAMEPMQDEALSGVTGQDGISIGLQTNLTAGLKIHDTDGAAGVTGVTANGAGAIVIDGFSISRDATTDTIDITIDADDGGTGGAFLNVGVSLPNNLTIALGGLNVADSGRTAGGGTWSTSATVSAGSTATPVPLINLGTMTLGATTLNIQLGNEPQGNMIAIDTTISGGINISGFAINDANSGGALSTDLQIVDNGGTVLSVDTGIDITSNGLVIGLGGIGDTANGLDVRMANLNVGGSGDIGDVELVGLNLTGNLVIYGK